MLYNIRLIKSYSFVFDPDRHKFICCEPRQTSCFPRWLSMMWIALRILQMRISSAASVSVSWIIPWRVPAVMSSVRSASRHGSPTATIAQTAASDSASPSWNQYSRSSGTWSIGSWSFVKTGNTVVLMESSLKCMINMPRIVTLLRSSAWIQDVDRLSCGRTCWPMNRLANIVSSCVRRGVGYLFPWRNWRSTTA